MSKTLFAIIGLAIILSTNAFGQPRGKQQGHKPSGLITEIGMPSMDVKGNRAKPNTASGQRKQNNQLPFDKGYLSPGAKAHKPPTGTHAQDKLGNFEIQRAQDKLGNFEIQRNKLRRRTQN